MGFANDFIASDAIRFKSNVLDSSVFSWSFLYLSVPVGSIIIFLICPFCFSFVKTSISLSSSHVMRTYSEILSCAGLYEYVTSHCFNPSSKLRKRDACPFTLLNCTALLRDNLFLYFFALLLFPRKNKGEI